MTKQTIPLGDDFITVSDDKTGRRIIDLSEIQGGDVTLIVNGGCISSQSKEEMTLTLPELETTHILYSSVDDKAYVPGDKLESGKYAGWHVIVFNREAVKLMAPKDKTGTWDISQGHIKTLQEQGFAGAHALTKEDMDDIERMILAYGREDFAKKLALDEEPTEIWTAIEYLADCANVYNISRGEKSMDWAAPKYAELSIRAMDERPLEELGLEYRTASPV